MRLVRAIELGLLLAAACKDYGATDTTAATSTDGGAEATADGGTDAAANADGAACAPDADVTSDPKNCGRCGHDCLGGGCMQGVCQPVALGASDDAPVLTLAVDDARVLWMTTVEPEGGLGRLYACPTSGCPAGGPNVLAKDTIPGAIGTNGTTTLASFLFGFANVARVETTGALTSITAFASRKYVAGLVAHGGDFYGIDSTGDAGTQTRNVLRWSGGATLEALGSFEGPTVNPGPAVVTDTHLYLGAVNTGEILGCALPGCSSFGVFVTAASNGIEALATAGNRVYFTHNDALSSCADGDTCTGVADDVSMNAAGGPVHLVAARGGVVAFATANDVYRCDAASCTTSVVKLAHEPAGIQSSATGTGVLLAVDDAAVYWAALGDGNKRTIMKVARQ